MANHRRQRQLLVTVGILVAIITSACSTADGPGKPQPPSSITASEHDMAASASPAGGLPSAHVHGVARNPADGLVYLATHDGLFRISEGAAPARVGPVIDFMGFTIVGPNHFYASGHPGPGVDLPDPVGLIETTDGGNTWIQRSRQGQSDFHTLTSSIAGIVGFDGKQMATTIDGRTWQQINPPAGAHAVAASPDGAVLLVTSPSGLARSTDKGQTWQLAQTPLLLRLAAWADATTVVGVGPDGRIATSTDAAATWKAQASVGAPPHALGAHRAKDGSVEILAVTEAGLVRSTDNGTTFSPYGH
jgi:DNA-binding beta-propeller fold protein YncE